MKTNRFDESSPNRKGHRRGPGDGEGEDPSDPSGGSDVVIRLKSFFVRRNNIYLEEISGQLRCLNSGMCKLQKALKKT